MSDYRPQDHHVFVIYFRVEKVCPSCGIDFVGRHNNVYCAICGEGKSVATTQKHRAKKKGLSEHFTPHEWVTLLARYNGGCAKCGSTDNVAADHIVPLSQGGTNTIDNIQPLCKSCNSQKRDKIADYR